MSHIYKKEKENLHGEITLEGIWWHEVYFICVSIASNLVQPNTSNLHCMYGIIALYLGKVYMIWELKGIEPTQMFTAVIISLSGYFHQI